MTKNKYYNQLLKNGYCIINHAFKKHYCEELIKKIEDLYEKRINDTMQTGFFLWSGNYKRFGFKRSELFKTY